MAYDLPFRVKLYIKEFKCDICDRIFGSPGNLSSHKRIHKERTYKCQICKLKFFKRISLINHMATAKHDIYPPPVPKTEFVDLTESPVIYMCPECDTSFVSQVVYDMHLKLHAECVI